MDTKIPSEVRTHTRDGMICPACFHDGLEEHPGYIDEYTGTAALFYATRCPNEDCKHHFGEGVPSDLVKMQYEKSSILHTLTTSLTRTHAIGAVGALIVGVLVIGLVLGVGPGAFLAGPDITVHGTVVTASGDPVENATITVLGTDLSTVSDANGSYTLANLTDGSYLLSVEPASASLAASTVHLDIDRSGAVSARGSYDARFNETLSVTLTEPTPVRETAYLRDGAFLLDFANPVNAERGVTVRLTPPPSDSITDETTVSTAEPVQIDIPGALSAQSVSVLTGVATASETVSGIWDGQVEKLTISGNLAPQSLSLAIDADANKRSQVEEYTVRDGTTIEHQIAGSAPTDLAVTFWGGTAEALTTTTGTYTGDNPRIEIPDDSVPAQVTVTVTGVERTERARTTGVLTDTLAVADIEGSLAAQDAVITFTGGRTDESELASETLTASAESGTTTDERVLLDDADAGTYRFDFDVTADQNADLVTAGYAVNGERTEVSSGTETIELTLADGDRVLLWIEAEQDSEAGTPDASALPENDGFTITDVSVDSTQVAVGEPISVAATIRRDGDGYSNAEVALFKNDEQVYEDRGVWFSTEPERTYTEFPTVSFDRAGTHMISVNDRSVTITVGDEEARYGAGSIQGDVTRLSDDGGTVAIDSSGDGTLDCTVSADGGSCDLGSLSPGEHQFAVDQTGVRDVGFELNYRAQYGANDVRVDIDGDGAAEFRHTGHLEAGQTISGSAQVDAGEQPIYIATSNDGELDYEISWAETGQVVEPTMSLDGERVIAIDENFRGERTETIEGLADGTYTLRFESPDTENEFKVRLEWVESGDALYPDVTANGERLCRGATFIDGGVCTPGASLRPGVNTLSFDGGADEFEYTLSYTARAVPETVTIDVNENRKTIRESDRTDAGNAAWTVEQLPIAVLTDGFNTIDLRTTAPDGFQPAAEAQFEYAYTITPPQTPRLIVTNGDGEQFETTVPDRNLDHEGILVEEYVTTVPAEWFTRGENELRVVSTNGGVIDTTVTATTERDGSLRLAPATDE